MIKVGIAGGAGYTAGELLRILLNHPEAEISFVHSSSNAGNKLYKVHLDLIGETELVFTDKLDLENIDVIFLCMGHGNSRTFVEANNIPENVRIIDLSNDYRLKADSDGFVYGLPETNREKIKSATKIANPGCFATAIQLSLLPLANAGLLKDEVHVNAITGSTGAGQQPTRTSHFSWRNNNISVYKAFQHQHLGEIGETMVQLDPEFSKTINFVPVRGDFARGIMAAVYVACDKEQDEIVNLYRDYYKDHQFTIVSDTNPDLKQVVNSNKCVLFVEKHLDKIFIISMIDNLVKGASGQAVHNMNLMFGLPEDCGLKLKTVAF